MRRLPRWLCYELRADPKHPDKPRKVPMQARRIGLEAASTRSDTWSTFDAAVEALARCSDYRGIGFALGGGFVGADLDHCIVPDGTIAAWAVPIIRTLDSYTEVSVSGTGIHVIARGSLPEGRRRKGGLEVYDWGRYFTVSGRHVERTRKTVEERSRELALVHSRYLRDDPVMPARLPSADRSLTIPADDADLLERAAKARNGAKFQALYAGDLAGHGSGSEADLALCNLLAFWTGGDAARMDRLFRSSGLYRPKWDTRRGEQTYGQRTIAMALRGNHGARGSAA